MKCHVDVLRTRSRRESRRGKRESNGHEQAVDGLSMPTCFFPWSRSWAFSRPNGVSSLAAAAEARGGSICSSGLSRMGSSTHPRSNGFLSCTSSMVSSSSSASYPDDLKKGAADGPAPGASIWTVPSAGTIRSTADREDDPFGRLMAADGAGRGGGRAP